MMSGRWTRTRVTVDWGDGTPIEAPTLGAGGTFSLNHLYNVPGSYEITTTAVDDDGGIAHDTRLVVIADLPPVIAPADLGTRRGRGALHAHGALQRRERAGRRLDGHGAIRHRPRVAAAFERRPELRASEHLPTGLAAHGDGERHRPIRAERHARPSPWRSLTWRRRCRLGPTWRSARAPRSLRQVGFTDPGADTWTAQVSFGDGSAPLTLPNLTARSFTLTHLYAQTGRFPVTVTVSDSDGASGSDAFFVDVTAQPPLR